MCVGLFCKCLESLGDLTQEFFSLDVSKLEASIMSLPFHKHIGLREDEMDPEFLTYVTQKTTKLSDVSVQPAGAVEKEINMKMLSLISDKKEIPSKSDNLQSEEDKPKENIQPVNVSAAPLEQRQNRRQRVKDAKPTNENEDLQFIENLGKQVEESGEKTDQHSVINKVEKVQIQTNETKNLEDWLDDFLDE